MQEDRCDKAPILSRHNRTVIFCSIFDKNIGILCIVEDIDNNIVKTMNAGCQFYLVSGKTPHSDSASSNDPGDPGDACQPSCSTLPTQSRPVTHLGAQFARCL